MTVYVCDTETNGRDPGLEVIELAYMPVHEGNWLAAGPMSVERFCPKQGSTNGALAAHHILNIELMDSPPSEQAALPADALYVIAHNVDYDWGALGQKGYRRICTLAMARHHYEEEESRTLGAMIYKFFPAVQARQMLKDAHSAGADATMCHLVLHKILEDKGLSFDTAEQLWEHSEACRIPRLMPFGKYYKQPIKNLPYDYKTWCLKQKDMDPYVLKAIRESL